MKKNWKILTVIAAWLAWSFVGAGSAAAQGNCVIPHVPDGRGGDGTAYRTRFSITNLGPDPATPVTKARLIFFRKDGTPWQIQTSLGTSSEIPLSLGAFQTIRIETLGSGSLTTGYAILRNLENATAFAEDYQLNVTIYYEVKKANDVIDTVTVSGGQPTIAWVQPAEIDVPAGLLTGLAIVNLADASNRLVLHLYESSTPATGAASETASIAVLLRPNEQRSIFLTDNALFPTLAKFRGMLLGSSEKPVAVLGMLQTPTPAGVQYATMTPTYADALRRNGLVYMKETYPLDADQLVSDYYLNRNDAAPWDLLLEKTQAGRELAPRYGAQIAAIGNLSDSQFDAYTIEQLQALTYSTAAVDLGDASPNLAPGFSFGLKTGLGRYAKIRIVDVIQRNNSRDLALKVLVNR